MRPNQLSLLLVASVLMLFSQPGRAGFWDDLGLGKKTSNTTTAPGSGASLAGLTEDQMVGGLKDALGNGLQHAVTQLGHEGGFLTNLNVRIPLPQKLQTVEKTLRAVGQGKLADDFVNTMNHAAEQAVPVAGSVFVDALKQMKIEDAKNVLTGPQDAATQYFQRTTQTNLYAKFYPLVKDATGKTGATAAYKKLMEKAATGDSFGGFTQTLNTFAKQQGVEVDVDDYVTNKALDGLFKMVAEEEKRIRQNPVARTTDLLQKVFGSVKQ